MLTHSTWMELKMMPPRLPEASVLSGRGSGPWTRPGVSAEGMVCRPVPSAGLTASFYFRPRANNEGAVLVVTQVGCVSSSRMAAGSSAQLSGCLQEGSRNSAGARTSHSGCFASLLVCKSCLCKPPGNYSGPKPCLFFGSECAGDHLTSVQDHLLHVERCLG